MVETVVGVEAGVVVEAEEGVMVRMVVVVVVAGAAGVEEVTVGEGMEARERVEVRVVKGKVVMGRVGLGWVARAVLDLGKRDCLVVVMCLGLLLALCVAQ
jgi:hypothetical protein